MRRTAQLQRSRRFCRDDSTYSVHRSAYLSEAASGVRLGRKRYHRGATLMQGHSVYLGSIAVSVRLLRS
jgi:uncharacterized protein (DUF2461 family)